MPIRHDVIHDPTELEEFWRELIAPLGFSSRQIFAFMIQADGEVFRHMFHVTECPREPESEMVAAFAGTLRMAADEFAPGGSCALLWARPTGGGTRATDREWVRCLTDAFTNVHLNRWPVFVADDSVMRVVAPDDLLA
jgi:hypothetical protein